MSKSYDKLIKKALKESKDKGIISEGFGYPEKMNERMHPEIEGAIRERKTSIGNHPALPSGGVRPYDQKLLLGRFMEVVNTCKEAFDVNEINESDLPEMASGVQKLLFGCMESEREHRGVLEELAERLVREDYDVSEDLVEFNCKLVDNLTMERQLTREFENEEFDLEFEKADDINNAEGEVSRFLQVLESYRLAPEVTRRRMYIETVQAVLSGSTKIFIDSESSGNLLYLPIDRLLRGNMNITDQSMTSSIEEPLSQLRQASEQMQDLRSRPLR